ncbi:WXG100 family type VII secretion target [Nocardia amikacinitolerans]|uniref:WXG100 family type VII secretion target n=1 Tax=Nocardia amikacinitolerans TaxID=756689 RepID=UPI0035577524
MRRTRTKLIRKGAVLTNSPDAATDFAVVPAEVTDAGRFVQLTAESLVSGLRSLDADVSTLLESWKGTSADAYRAGWDEIKQGADTVLDSLSTMAELLGVTSQVLEDQDKKRAQTTSSLDLP